MEENQDSHQAYGHALDLSGDEKSLFSRFRESNRRAIRKAQKEVVRVTFGMTRDAVSHYYLLHCLTRKRLGLPPQPAEFFHNIHEYLIRKGRGVVALAEYRDKIIVGAVSLSQGRWAIYKYGASDKKYAVLRANNLIIWEGIRHFLSRVFDTLDFGRTEIEDHGLRRFKNDWGAREEWIRHNEYDYKNGCFLQKTDRGSRRRPGFSATFPCRS